VDDVARVMLQLTDRTIGDVADDWIVRQSTGGSTRSNQMLTCGTVRANGWVPHGTPGLANEGYVKRFWGPGDSNPGPPLRATA
jgi:hypothetical protein